MMRRLYLGLLAFAAVAAYATVPVYAVTAHSGSASGGEDATVQAEPDEGEDAPSSTDDTENIDDPVAKAKAKALNAKYVSVLANLDTQEAQHFAIVVVNQNLISTVKAVEEDVAHAVAGCAENNKGMADAVNGRFSVWKEAVRGPMGEAESNVNNMILAQDYLSKEDFSELFGLIDDVRKYNSSRFEKTPVTTPEACEFMLTKMDETENQMIGMLRATLASYPSAQKKNQD